MNLSREVGEPLVKAFESCLRPIRGRPGYFTAYRCPAGVVTIGWGTTNEHGNKVRMGTVWSQAQCDAAFSKDAGIFAAHVTKQLRGAKVTQSQFDALTSWSYNCGGPPSSSVWTYARKGDVEGVCVRLERWNRGGGRVLAGLVRRRRAECELYRGRIDTGLRIAGTHRYKVPAAEQAMPRQLDRPTPPADEVMRRTKRETTIAAGGAATTAGGSVTTGDKSNFGEIALMIGGIVLVLGVVLLTTKVARVAKDWA